MLCNIDNIDAYFQDGGVTSADYFGVIHLLYVCILGATDPFVFFCQLLEKGPPHPTSKRQHFFF